MKESRLIQGMEKQMASAARRIVSRRKASRPERQEVLLPTNDGVALYTWVKA